MATNTTKRTPRKTSAILRARLRTRIAEHLEKHDIPGDKAAARTGLTRAQVSRIRNDYNALSLDRLVDAAHSLGLAVAHAFKPGQGA